jgi:outer membrane protein W
MKKILTVAVVILLATAAANAQEFKKFRVGVAAGYAMPGGEGAKGGVCFAVEPGYRISDQLILGLRLESAVIVRGFSEDLGAGFDVDVAGIGSYTVNGQYYFSNESFRPFVGAGLGLYSLAAVKVDVSGFGSGEAAAAESKFGFYPRVGFDAGHFTLQLEYNLIPATKVDGGEFKNSYLGIKIGGYFGGGRM